MKRRNSILFLAAAMILGLVYLGFSVGQTSALIDRYETKAANDVQVKQFHAYLALFNGTDWSPEQKTLLTETGKNPDAMRYREQEVAAAFGSQGKQIFGGVGSYDLRDLRAVYHAATLADKKELMRLDRGTIWRQEMALYAAEHSLTDEQIKAFYQVSRWIDVAANKTKDEAETFAQAVVVPAFGLETAKQIFGPIGSVKFAEMCAKPHGPNDAVVFANCSCSYGSSFNWSCSGTCKEISAGNCTRLDDGCGFLGYYACDSSCGSGDLEG